MSMPTPHTKKAPATAPTVIEGQPESRANGSPNHVPVPTKEKNMTIVQQTTDNVNAGDDWEVVEQVNVPDVVAPHIAAWNRLSDATETWVSNRDPHPRSAGLFVPWCAECVSAKEEGEVAHPLSDRKQAHESLPVHVYTGHSGTIQRQDGVIGLPSLEISVIRSTKSRLTPGTQGQFINLSAYTRGERYCVANLSIFEARELVDVLQAAIDLATGRDDFDEAGA